MPWLRLHTDILADPKLMRASREGAKHLHLTPWLFAFAKQADDGGRLSVGELAAEPQDIASMIPCVTVVQVRNCLKELKTIGVLVEDSDGVLRFSRWAPRQSKPSASHEAVAHRMRNSRHRRELAESGHAEGEGDVTPNLQRKVGVTVTPPEEKRGEENRREENTSPLRGGWPAEFSEILAGIGVFEPGRVGKALRGMVGRYGVDRSREMVTAFVQLAPHQRADGAFDRDVQAHQFCTPERLAQTAHFWYDHTEPIEARNALPASG